MTTLDYTRREFLKAIGLGAAALGIPGCTGAARLAADEPFQGKPNFVFILIDDLGWTDVGCYGSNFYETPNIDRLTAEGMKFTDAYAAAPVCSPTRASIMTGKYPARLKLTNYLGGNWSPKQSPILPAQFADKLEPDEVTIAEALKTSGYISASIGKWHLGGSPSFPRTQGFDVSPQGPSHYGKGYKTDDNYFTDVLTHKAVTFIEKHRDRPFLLYLSHHAVHIPIVSKKKKIAKYKAKLRANPQPMGSHNNPYYAAMVESVDDSVGRVLETLNRLNIDEKTVVIFFSDNGGLVSEYGGGIRLHQLGIGRFAKYTPPTTNWPLRSGKGYLYEGGIREVCIVKWPGVTPTGSVCRTPVISNDFFPTMCEMAGIEPASVKTNGPIDGMSLVPLLTDPAAKLQREALYWHYPHFSNSGGLPAGAVRMGEWKLIENYEYGKVELYNLKNDLSEVTNLAYVMPKRTEQLKTMLARWREQVGANMPQPNPDYKPKTSR